MQNPYADAGGGCEDCVQQSGAGKASVAAGVRTEGTVPCRRWPWAPPALRLPEAENIAGENVCAQECEEQK